MNEANHQKHSREWRAASFFYAMPYEGHYIWGAYGRHAKNLHERLFRQRPR